MLGFLNLLKPPGMTSHDVVDVVRRITKMRQVGHAGTLDPGAAGVLVVALGFAARLLDFLPDRSKSYRAEITLGSETDSGDAQGAVTRQSPCDDLTEDRLRAAMLPLLGAIEQRPPAHSAVQVGGKRLHRLARQGIAVEAPLRCVRIRRFELLRFAPPRAVVAVDCSAGTYIRALAVDLGRHLTCGAHLSFLLRTRVGRFRLADSTTLEQLVARDGALEALLIPPREALAPIAAFRVDAAQRERARHGNVIVVAAAATENGPAHALIEDESGLLIALARCASAGARVALQPLKVNPEVAG